jgi:hypothetical protein
MREGDECSISGTLALQVKELAPAEKIGIRVIVSKRTKRKSRIGSLHLWRAACVWNRRQDFVYAP